MLLYIKTLCSHNYKDFMKKIFLLLLFLVACGGTKSISNDAGVNSEIVSPVTSSSAGNNSTNNICENMYDFHNMFVQTSCDWEKLENSNYDFVAKHDQSKTLLTIKSENFDTTYDHFVLSKLRSLRNNNVNVDDIDETKIDDVKFLFVQADKEDVESWHFFGWKNKIGYSISCGGPKNSISKESCQNVFNFIKIK